VTQPLTYTLSIGNALEPQVLDMIRVEIFPGE